MAGKMINPPANETNETQFVLLSDSDRELFKAPSEDKYSEVFRVPNDGQGVLLTSYCLEKPLLIERVKVDVQAMPHGTADCCCKVEQSEPLCPTGISEAECVAQTRNGNRGVWAMGYGVNIGVISVPGSYRLVAQTPGDLDKFTVCGRLITKPAMCNIPAPLIFGNT